MTYDLTPEEDKQLHEMLINQPRDIRSLNIIANIFLILGGLLIIVTAIYLVNNLTDNAAYLVGLPNFVCGMILIISYFILSRRVVRINKLNRILSKLYKMKVAA